MNFLAEVLSSAEKIEIEEINQTVPELKVRIDNLKSDIVQYTDNVYIKYSGLGRPKRNRRLISTAQQLEGEIKVLQKNAEHVTKKDLRNSVEKLAENLQTLDTIDFTLKVLSDICKINENIHQATTLLDTDEFLKCKKIIGNVEALIENIPQDEKLIVIDDIITTLNETHNLLLNKIRHCFLEKVVTTKGDRMARVKILNDFKPLDQALLAMFYNESVIFSLSDLSKFLWDNFFVPLVDNVVEIRVDKQVSFSELQIDIVDVNKKSPYNLVFSNLKTVLMFLQSNFNFPLTDLKCTLTTVEYIGLDIRDNLSELLVKHCLADTIPSTVEELKNYQVVIQDTEKLETALKDSKLFSADMKPLLTYANNIDFHFINKRCQQYSLQSKQIMKKDLHDMIEVGVSYNPHTPLGTELEQFGQCSISKSVVELLNYCEQILHEAVESSDISAGRLLTTCQNVIRNYTTFVPEYHSKLLKTIPQQVALFYNNCYYMSHKLHDWNGTFVSKLPATLNLPRIAFEPEASLLKQVGSETFKHYVKGQMQQINEIMKESGLEGSTLEGDLKPVTEKCVRQCLRQQELLKTVWHKVLSYQTYNKILGKILNTLCVCLITSITTFEDIPSNSAEQLTEIIKIVLSRGPKLFTDPKEVSLYVASWYKLNELNFVLGASLVDINDRWADGKGPLALQFKATEMKSLVRALFQNTDRRAAVLAKIKE